MKRRNKWIALMLAVCLLFLLCALTACSPRGQHPETTVHWYVPSHDEPALEELFSEEPYASLLPASAEDVFDMKSSYRRLYDEHSGPYKEAILHTSWGARNGGNQAVGTMDIDIYDADSQMDIGAGQIEEASGLTLEKLRQHTIVTGEKGISFNVYVKCVQGEKGYLLHFNGHHDDMTAEQLYRMITSAKVFQTSPAQSTEEEGAVSVLSDTTIELNGLSRCELPAEGTVSVYEEPFIRGTEKETDKLRQGDTAYISAVRELCWRGQDGFEYKEQAFRVVYVRDGKTVTGWVMHDLLPEPVFELKEGAKYYFFEGDGRKLAEHVYHHAADEQGSQSPWSVILYSEVEGMWKLAGSGGSEIYVEDLSVLEETERPDPSLDPSPLPAG